MVKYHFQVISWKCSFTKLINRRFNSKHINSILRWVMCWGATWFSEHSLGSDEKEPRVWVIGPVTNSSHKNLRFIIYERERVISTSQSLSKDSMSYRDKSQQWQIPTTMLAWGRLEINLSLLFWTTHCEHPSINCPWLQSSQSSALARYLLLQYIGLCLSLNSDLPDCRKWWSHFRGIFLRIQ